MFTSARILLALLSGIAVASTTSCKSAGHSPSVPIHGGPGENMEQIQVNGSIVFGPVTHGLSTIHATPTVKVLADDTSIPNGFTHIGQAWIYAYQVMPDGTLSAVGNSPLAMSSPHTDFSKVFAPPIAAFRVDDGTLLTFEVRVAYEPTTGSSPQLNCIANAQIGTQPNFNAPFTFTLARIEELP